MLCTSTRLDDLTLSLQRLSGKSLSLRITHSEKSRFSTSVRTVHLDAQSTLTDSTHRMQSTSCSSRTCTQLITLVRLSVGHSQAPVLKVRLMTSMKRSQNLVTPRVSRQDQESYGTCLEFRQ